MLKYYFHLCKTLFREEGKNQEDEKKDSKSTEEIDSKPIDKKDDI